MFAHQGGWDEILMVVAPMAVFGVLLLMANRRADKQLSAKGSDAKGKDTSQTKTAKAKRVPSE